jgi:hypothetical protein
MGERLDVDEMLITRLLAHSIEAKVGLTWRYERSRQIKPMMGSRGAAAAHQYMMWRF